MTERRSRTLTLLSLENLVLLPAVLLAMVALIVFLMRWHPQSLGRRSLRFAGVAALDLLALAAAAGSYSTVTPCDLR